MQLAEGYILWCPKEIHTQSFVIQYAFMLLFHFLEDLNIERSADDTTIYMVNEKKESVSSVLETS